MARGRDMRIAAAALLVWGVLNGNAAAQTDPTFEEWRAGFIERASARGRTEETLDALFEGVTPDERVLTLATRQSTFSSPLWAYLDARLSQSRIDRGRALLVEHSELLATLENEYGVPAEVLLAVWAMESRFGEVTLDYDPRRSLATLAHTGRRMAYFDNELMALADLMEQGLLPEITSSWDGGLGQPQFMPSNFLEYSADGDGDGVRNIWTNTPDVLASIAQYLRLHGWTRDEPLFIEVTAPGDISEEDERTYRTLREWHALGTRRLDSGSPDSDLSVRLLRPDGLLGPALLTTRNYDVLRRYNGAGRYGVAASLLAHAIDGQPPLQTPWPRPADAMTAEELMTAQRVLATLGHDVGTPDGIYGEKSWLALNAFARERALPEADYPTRAVYEALSEAEPSTPAAP